MALLNKENTVQKVDISSLPKTVAVLPIVKPLISLAHSRRFILIVLAVVANLLLPTIPNITADRLTLLQNVVIYGGGILLTGLTAENIMQARPTLPATAGAAISAIAGELVTATTSTSVSASPAPPTALASVDDAKG